MNMAYVRRSVRGGLAGVLGVVGFMAVLSGTAHARVWTDTSGKFRIEAEFVELRDGKVTLRRPDASIVAVPLDKLSPADQALARQQAGGGPAAAGGGKSRTWTDSTGKFKIDAEFVELRDGKVTLKRTDGKTAVLPLDRLSPEDRQLAERFGAPAGAPALVGVPNTPRPAVPAVAGTGGAPDEAIRQIRDALEQGKLRAVWDALPPSHQADVNSVVQTFATNMDRPLWNAGAGALKQVVSILKQKKEFILNYPKLQALTAGQDAAKVNAGWDVLVDVLDTIVNSDLTDLNKLKTIDLGQFLDTTGAKLVDKLAAASKLAGGVAGNAIPVNVANAKISLLKHEGDTATVRIEAGEKPQDLELRLVQGKWLPKEMVDDWDKNIADAKASMAFLKSPEFQQQKGQVMFLMAAVNGLLAQLMNAQNQQEFNAAIDNVVNMVSNAAQGGPGGARPGAPRRPGQ